MKNILLIGGSHGIGLSLVRQLSKDHNIYIASRSFEEQGLANVTHITFDATKDSLDHTQLPPELHGFVYCPGSINLKPFKMLDLESFKKDMEINFFSLVKVVKHIMPLMAEGSSMVFFSTVAVKMGMPYHASIAAAKGAIEGFTKSLAAEYAPKLRFNAIAPSLVDTPLASRLLGNDRKREMMAQRHPLKRVGSSEELAYIAKFLLSEKSSWITGQIIGVDGGLSTLNVN
jgi:NAD(P)-dependent dehydrogenase (short-subunit alcohol dehydrogenase family)